MFLTDESLLISQIFDSCHFKRHLCLCELLFNLKPCWFFSTIKKATFNGLQVIGYVFCFCTHAIQLIERALRSNI